MVGTIDDTRLTSIAGPSNHTVTAAGEDAFLLKLDSAGNFVSRAKTWGGISRDRAFGIAVDGGGNAYAAGFFTGSADFDPDTGTFTLTAAAATDVFISKLDSAGNFVWAKQLDGRPYDPGYTQGVALDDFGNIYVVRSFGGYLSKLDSAGNLVWTRQLGNGINNFPTSVATDGTESVYSVGMFSGTQDFDPGPGSFNLSSDGWDVFISKLDSAGGFIWAKKFGGTASAEDHAHGVAVDGSGNVYTVGTFRYTADFDPGPGTFNLTNRGNNMDGFVSKLDSEGNFVWAGQMGGSAFSPTTNYAVTVDQFGTIFTAGYFQDATA